MDADEKLTALKKAYADIILSISKEAAARVIASDRKSVRCQHELKVAKEEAVRMLLRLKQMMDSQVSEAEEASLNQQKKIEELEAQLQEAEDIVRDLREELGEVQAELERLKSENSHCVKELSDICSKGSLENKISLCQSSKYLPPNESSAAFDVTLPYVRQRNERTKCYNKILCTCGAYIGNQDLPSIILRGKDPGLYRNGCTQRIRACERNVLDRDLCISKVTDKVKTKKNGRERNEGKHTSETPVSGAKIPGELEQKLLADINLGTFQSFPQKRKRAVRRRKTIIHLGGKQSYLFSKPDQLSEHSARIDPISVNDNAHSAGNPSNVDSGLSQAKAESGTQLGCADASENETKTVEICSAKTMLEDDGLNEKVVPLMKVIGFSEGLWSPDCKIDVEKVDVPSHTLGGLPSQPVRERVIKYTFQRKRKRQALSGFEVNGSHETEKKTGDGQNADKKLEEPKPSLSKELSRDRRRLAQVARQLISLSEKKWWH